MKAKELIVGKMFRVAEAVEENRYSTDRAIDEMYGYMKGVSEALNVEGEEFDQISDLWTAFHMSMHPAYDVASDYWKELV